MKKQLFLLSLFSLLLTSAISLADSCCKTDDKCCTKTTSSDCKPCELVSGKTHLRTETTFTNGSPIYTSMFNSNALHNLRDDDQHGAFEVTVYGSKNVKRDNAAAFFFPYAHTSYTVSGEVTPQSHASVMALSTIDLSAGIAATDDVTLNIASGTLYGTGASTNGNLFLVDRATFKFDPNKDTSILRPWNFGITYAALFEPTGAAASGSNLGTGLVSNPAFKSTIAPEFSYSNVGAGFALRYHFSDDKDGWWGSLSTSVEHVRTNICLNEKVSTEKDELTTANFAQQALATAAQNIYGLNVSTSKLQAATGVAATATPLGAVHEAYINDYRTETTTQIKAGTGFPVEQDGLTNNPNSTPPKNMTEAFDQAAWNYGKIGCAQTKTRLADIELCLGYQWFCGDCAATNWYVGLVIPTGNKPCATYVADAVVGNGQHAAIMAGSSLELMLSDNEDRQVYYRLDTNGRYLFRNTQKRLFDLKGNEWSRYMMVWENKEAYEAAVTNANAYNPGTSADPNQFRNYTPGVNVFAHDMRVKPGFHGRLNQSIYFKSENFRAELGWNVLARAKECAEFSCAWTQKPAFADSSYRGGLGLNNHRTIYNDAQLMSVNAIDTFNRKENTAGAVFTLANAALSADAYETFQIEEKDVNLDSASTPAAVIHTPYLTLGYAWNSDYKPAVSVGAQYEFAAGNRALNKWMVWGKLDFAF